MFFDLDAEPVAVQSCSIQSITALSYKRKKKKKQDHNKRDMIQHEDFLSYIFWYVTSIIFLNLSLVCFSDMTMVSTIII